MWDCIKNGIRETEYNIVRGRFCSIANRFSIPGILVNTCMVCENSFYDYANNLPSENGMEETIGITRIYPPEIPVNIPTPNMDLPETCVRIYTEAANIFITSPRSAAVLLRLCLQQLLQEQGYRGSINNMIAKAVTDGVPEYIQQFMDTCRNTGNDAAHDLTIDKEEAQENAEYMFTVINTVTEWLITNKKKAQENYNKLPESVRKSIENRNKK